MYSPGTKLGTGGEVRRRAVVQVEALRLLGELVGDERDVVGGGGGGPALHRVLSAEEVIPRRVDPLAVLYRRVLLRRRERLLADRVVRLDLFLSTRTNTTQ